MHYDVMFEWHGTLRTWAVETEPRPGIELRARALPDHRLAYLDYEGPISGDRGHVRRVDRGTYEPIHWLPDRVDAVLAGSVFRGLTSIRQMSDQDWLLRLRKVD